MTLFHLAKQYNFNSKPIQPYCPPNDDDKCHVAGPHVYGTILITFSIPLEILPKE